MTKKILLDMLKASKWIIALSIWILYFLYGEVSNTVFAYFCFLQLFQILQVSLNSSQRDLNKVIMEFSKTVALKLKFMSENIYELKKLLQGLIDYVGRPDKNNDIH